MGLAPIPHMLTPALLIIQAMDLMPRAFLIVGGRSPSDLLQI